MEGTMTVGTASARRGDKVRGELPVPEAYAAQLQPPWLTLVNGVENGPIVYVGAGTHGDEYNSMQAVMRAADVIDPAAVHGAVILVPVANRAALQARQRHTPADGRDLDTCYPGDPQGSPSEVLAHTLLEGAIGRAQYALDLHTATRGGYNLPNANTAPHTPAASLKAREMAALFGVRAIIALEAVAGPVGHRMGWNLDHSLFVQATARDIPCPIVEFGEGGRLDPGLIEFGTQGTLNVLAGLGVLQAQPVQHGGSFVASEAIAVRARTQGFLYLVARAGEPVKRGQLIARIISFTGQTEDIASPVDGLAIRETTEGMVMPDDRVMVVAPRTAAPAQSTT